MLKPFAMSFLLLFTVHAGALTLHKHSRSQIKGPHIIVVRASTGHLLRGYLAWVQSHPQARPEVPKELSSKDLSGNQEFTRANKTSRSAPALGFARPPESAPFLIHTPSIDLYSPIGKSIFYSYNAVNNARFLRELPKSIDNRAYRGTGGLRPTLREAVNMMPELKKYAPTILATDGYTIFALTCTRSHCAPQREALNQIAGHLQGTDIRVVELLLP
jgi:hypothetical protein